MAVHTWIALGSISPNRLSGDDFMRIAGTCALVVFCLMVGYIAPKRTSAQDVAKGKALYEERCMLCHGPKGDGKGPGAIALNPKPADYTRKKFWDEPNIEKKITDTVIAGKGQMRANPDLSPEQIQSIIIYMTQTFKPR